MAENDEIPASGNVPTETDPQADDEKRSDLFNYNIGITPVTPDDILDSITEVANRLKVTLTKSPLDPFRIVFRAAAATLTTVVNESIKFMETGKSFFENIENQYRLPQTGIHDAVVRHFKKLNFIEYFNLVSGAGKVNLYIILKPGLEDNEENKRKIWRNIHDTCPIGNSYEGTTSFSDMSSTGQVIEYKWEYGKKKHVYLKVSYKTRQKGLVIKAVDQKIKDDYKKVVERNYGEMGLGFEWQDFLRPSADIDGIKVINIKAVLSDKPNLQIDSTELSDWKSNENIDINPSEVLIFDIDQRVETSIEASD